MRRPSCGPMHCVYQPVFGLPRTFMLCTDHLLAVPALLLSCPASRGAGVYLVGSHVALSLSSSFGLVSVRSSQRLHHTRLLRLCLTKRRRTLACDAPSEILTRAWEATGRLFRARPRRAHSREDGGQCVKHRRLVLRAEVTLSLAR